MWRFTINYILLQYIVASTKNKKFVNICDAIGWQKFDFWFKIQAGIASKFCKYFCKKLAGNRINWSFNGLTLSRPMFGRNNEMDATINGRCYNMDATMIG